MNEALKEGSRGSSAGAGRHRLRSLLVISEVALAFVLLVGSGLMVKGFARLADDQKEGFTPENVLTMRITLTPLQYPEDHQTADFYNQTVARMQAVPGVLSACAVSNLPASDNWFTRSFAIEGRPDPLPGQSQSVNFQLISPAYFQTLRIAILKGREFTERDGRAAPPVAIISELMARRYWPDEDPIGKRIKLGSVESEARWFSIVGVTGDVRRFMFDKGPQPTLYFPHEQSPTRGMYFALRVTDDPMSAAAAARAQISSVDPDLPVYEIKLMEKVISDQLSGVSLSAGLMAILGVMALILSAVGVYGVMAYSVSQRTHEIGVRMALGAQPRDVLKMVVGQAMKLAGIGLALGLPLAFALSSAMSSMLFGIVALEPLTIAGFTLLLVGVSIVSSYLPARRAAKVNPMVALRCE